MSRNEYYKQYYQKNKERMQQQLKLNGEKTWHCFECNVNLKKISKYTHLKTKKHIKNCQRVPEDREIVSILI